MSGHEREVMDLAIDLHERRLRQLEASERERSLASAAREVGVPPELLDEARKILEERRANAVAKRRRNQRLAIGAISATSLIAAAWIALNPAPPAPIVEGFSAASARWTLDKDQGTEAVVEHRSDSVSVRVDRFAPGADGKYHVNLDRREGLEALDRYARVTVRLRGRGLEVARLFIEGDGERWRSPPIPIASEWTEIALPLDGFDHQVREGSGFRTVGTSAPEGAKKWSFKVGHFMNAQDKSGEVELDELRFE